MNARLSEGLLFCAASMYSGNVSQSQVMPACSTSNGIASTLTRSRIATSRACGLHGAVRAELRVGVRVGIDEAGRDHHAGGVDGRLRLALWFDDPPAGNRNVRAPRRRARAVDQGAVADEDVVGHALLSGLEGFL